MWAAKKYCVWDRSVPTAQPSGLSAFLWKDARAAAETVATDDLCLRHVVVCLRCTVLL